FLADDAGVFQGIMLKHLLEHTHGLDDSDLACVPLQAGRIDLESLVEQLATRRFAAPGAVYSYSNAGPWIAASILERMHARPFVAQLQDFLAPLRIGASRHHSSSVPGCAADVCPSRGARLTMSVP